jgi:hypothetical protein
MTREEKIQLAIEKGYTYAEVSGKIYNRFGNEITKKDKGYIMINLSNNYKRYNLRAHQFAYYYKYKKIVEHIDHINGIKDDNRIDNLREVTHQQNQHNRTKAKGYYLNKISKKYHTQIMLNNEVKYLGCFNTEQEARQTYLDAKKIYHII